MHIAARSILRRRYGALFAGVTRILYEEDLIFVGLGGKGLCGEGAPSPFAVQRPPFPD